MVRLKKQIPNFIFIIILGYFLYSKAPAIYNNFKSQSQAAPEVVLKNLLGQTVQLPQIGKKTILIFWATWCGPCKVELGRLDQMLKEEKIQQDQLVAINIYENAEQIKTFLSENNYQFEVALDESGVVAEKYHVVGTPTVIFIQNNGSVDWVTTGMSPLLGQRVSSFLNN